MGQNDKIWRNFDNLDDNVNIKDKSVFSFDVEPKLEYVYDRPEVDILVEKILMYMKYGISTHLLLLGGRGSGKTTTIKSVMKSIIDVREELMKRQAYFDKFIYINVREYPKQRAIMGKIIGEKIHGYDYGYIIEKFKEALNGRVILILDDIDLLNSRDLFYYLTRSVDIMTISTLQNVMWFDNLDDSTKSSYRPEKIFFPNYTSEQLKEILMLRAKYGLYHYDEGGIALIGTLVAKNYLGDARIAILALYHAGLEDKWDEDSIKKYIEMASNEVLEYTLSKLDFRQLVILTTLIDQPETNKAYIDIKKKLLEANKNIKDESLKEYNKWKIDSYSKATYFQDLKVLSTYGLITLIKKKVGQYHTYEAMIHVPKNIITDISNDLEQKFHKSL